MMNKQKLEKLQDFDYETTESGAKTVTFEGSDKRQRNLYKIQEHNRSKLKEFINSLRYEIIKEWRETDGWGDGFEIDYFEIKDRRNDEILNITGCDDNSTLFKICKSGGRALWKSIPNTTVWYKAEGDLT